MGADRLPPAAACSRYSGSGNAAMTPFPAWHRLSSSPDTLYPIKLIGNIDLTGTG
jgi:hypothetical protein